MSREPKKPQPEVETTGHSWDGIEEYNNPMPRWWLWTLYATILWGLGYVILFPAWPLVRAATPGLLGYATRGEVQRDVARWDQRNAATIASLAEADLTTVAPGTPLYDFAVNAGAAVFRANCSQCHGVGAAGSPGYPNLLDDDWLWGGDVEAIRTTVAHGVRNATDEDARFGAGQMPAFGTDQMLEPEPIAQAVEYVLQLSGQEHDAALAEAGAEVFADNCASCHGEDGAGDREMGAPDLTDGIWLYGGDRAAVTRTVELGRNGIMPAWGPRLSEADLNAVALYVHQLGGGE